MRELIWVDESGELLLGHAGGLEGLEIVGQTCKGLVDLRYVYVGGHILAECIDEVLAGVESGHLVDASQHKGREGTLQLELDEVVGSLRICLLRLAPPLSFLSVSLSLH